MPAINELLKLIFPESLPSLEELEKTYPRRNLPASAHVTRFAPSPTGFLHTGSLFTALIAKKVASQSGGVFFIRLEDTDTKREIAGVGEDLLAELAEFSLCPDEGYLGIHEKGIYGPYIQSQREKIYHAVIKHLLLIGRAYPCFATTDELSELRQKQEKAQLITGYYGEFAQYRDYPIEKAIEKIKNGEPYVIRFKSFGKHENKITVDDLIRGELSLSENDQDIVILKSDRLPTYHFAHVVDDHFMGTTTVTRGEEWLSSLPIHLDLFAALAWPPPEYAHLPLINKLDEDGNRRKLSKRKDKEAAVSYFLEDGYPSEALLTYLMSIANSNFEEWWSENRGKPLTDFSFAFNKMALEGALFDLDKVRFFARETLAFKTGLEVAKAAKKYAEEYHPKFGELINRDFNYFVQIIDIERDKPNPRKDYTTYCDIYDSILFFYKQEYLELLNREKLPFNPLYARSLIKTVLEDIRDNFDFNLGEDEWFAALKTIAARHGFAANLKTYKQDPASYLGHVGDVAEMLRIVLTTKKTSPNLYHILQILGRNRVQERINLIVEKYL
ncbi:MAG: glutamate--tRNA ligase [Bacilli bacterium]